MASFSIGCCDDVKGKENESHSQLYQRRVADMQGCCDDVKGKENERTAQLI